MSLLQKLFGTAPSQRTMLDDVQEVSSRLIIRGYRKVAVQHGCAPTAQTTDSKIMEIYAQVSQAFHAAAQKRGEHIPALVLNYIVLKFLQVNETIPDHLQQHLQYEIEK